MKRVFLLAALMVLLCGCAGGDRELERAMAYRSALLKAEGCRFSAEVTADYGDILHSFSMDCRTDANGNLSFSVTAPETIAGITGAVSQEGGTLRFDDEALHFELMAQEQLSPVSAPWIFMKTLRSGYLTSASTEGELLRLTIDDSYEEDALRLDIWLKEEDMPVRAEILYDGKRILTMDVKDFVLL